MDQTPVRPGQKYAFYGWETCSSVYTDQAHYPGIHTPLDLYDALKKIWCAQTCTPRLRGEWSPENITCGQCSITAFLAQDIFGGEVYGIDRGGGHFHEYNVVNGCVFDLTSEQVHGEALSYEDNPRQYREVDFQREEKRLRYEDLKRRLREATQKHIGIVVLGAVFVDIKGYPISQYIEGGRNAGRVLQVHGGVSRNVVEDIANVELAPTFLTVVDRSGISTDVIDKLRRHRINTDYIRRTEDGLGTWLALFDNNGDVVGSISKRPDLSEIGDILDEYGEEIFSRADSIAVEIDMEPEILKKVFTLAEKYRKEIYAVVSNMSIAMERRDLIKKTGCLVCNVQEAGILFSEDYEDLAPEKLREVVARRIEQAQIPRMIVTMGEHGAVYAENGGESGMVPAQKTEVIDTTGAGDAFFAGAAIGLTYGRTLREACGIGTRLAASVIATKENVCPRFLPEEFDLKIGN